MESYALFKFLKLFSETFKIRDINSDENQNDVKKENVTDRRKRSPYNENEHSNYEGGSREHSPSLMNSRYSDKHENN